MLDNVHRQGAGMVDIDDAINATTAIVPRQALAGREHRAGHQDADAHQQLERERDLRPVTRGGRRERGRRRSRRGSTCSGSRTRRSLFSAPSVTVPAHGPATISVTITADPVEGDLPTGGLYGGYLVFEGPRQNLDSVFSVPYAGYKGDYQSIVAIPTAPVIGDKLNGHPFIKAQQTYAQSAAGHQFGHSSRLTRSRTS